MGIETYSKVAANNSNTPPNGAPEGMNPGQVNDVIRQIMADIRTQVEDGQWVNLGATPTFATATSFTLPGDVTAIYHANRRVRASGTTPFTIVGTITGSTYSAPNTTVTVTWDSGSLNNTLNVVSFGVISATNRSVTAATIGAATGTVTSVAMSVPGFLSVSGSPVTTTGTLAVTGASLAQGLFVASPAAATGTVSARAITGTDLPAATTSAQGAVQLASAADVAAGTDTAKAVTPNALASSGGLPKGVLVFDGTPSTPTIVSATGSAVGVSLSKSAAGQVAVTLATARSAAKSPILVSAVSSNAGSAGIMQSPAPTTTTFTVYTTTVSGSSVFYQDSNFVTVALF